MLLGLAWRNLWRNLRRTLITMVALAMGTAGITFLHSYRESTYGELVRGLTAGLLGHLQVHGKGYQDSPTLETVVGNPLEVEARVRGALPGASSERRVLGAGLIGGKDTSAPAFILGLDPRGGEGFHRVLRGQDLSPEKRGVVLGEELARQLEVGPTDEVVLLGQAADGSTANDRFTVAGVAEAGSYELNASAVLMRLEDAQDFFGLGQGVHQLIVRLSTQDEDLTPHVSAVRAALDLATLEALSWQEMTPELTQVMAAKRRNQHAVDFLVFVIVSLGVLNAMTMATFERTREFGVMAALGTRPRRILALVLTESLLQGLLGFAAGLTVAVVALYGLGTIDLSGMLQGDVMGFRMPSAVVLGLRTEAVVSAAVTVLVTVVFGGLVPAVRAARLEPVEAMRHT